MASLLTPKRTCCCCYYHQLQPWFAKHFYFASCLNAFPFWHNSQVANRCFQLCPCPFSFLFNGLFPRWGFSLWQAASWLVIGMTFQIHYCSSHWQEKPTHSGFHSSKCWKNRGRQNNRQYGLKGRSFCREMKAGDARDWIPEYRITLWEMVALAPEKGRLICLKQQNRENSFSLWRQNQTCSWPWKYFCERKGLVMSRLTHTFKKVHQRCVQKQLKLLLEFRWLLLEEKWAHLLLFQPISAQHKNSLIKQSFNKWKFACSSLWKKQSPELSK